MVRRYSGPTSVTEPPPHAPSANDPVLIPYLAASDRVDADQSLCALIEREVRPLVARIVGQKAGPPRLRDRPTSKTSAPIARPASWNG